MLATQLFELMSQVRELSISGKTEDISKLVVEAGFDGWGVGDDEDGEFINVTKNDAVGAENNYKNQADIMIRL